MHVIDNAFLEARRHASFALPALPESAGLVRKLTEVVLDGWTSPVDRFTATLLLSEVFTNALLHGVHPRSEGTARISVDLIETESGLHVEVHDPNQGSLGEVAISHANARSESGRGLELVDGLAAAWGCKYTGAGKFVFFDLERSEDEPLTQSPVDGLSGRDRAAEARSCC
jgi:anti-sigma regulatory factor (Ser/Thr protein kinase)